MTLLGFYFIYFNSIKNRSSLQLQRRQCSPQKLKRARADDSNDYRVQGVNPNAPLVLFDLTLEMYNLAWGRPPHCAILTTPLCIIYNTLRAGTH